MSGGVGPQPVRAWALVVHGVLTRMSVDKIIWHIDKVRIGVGKRVVRVR